MQLSRESRVAAAELIRAWMAGQADDALVIMRQHRIMEDPVAVEFVMATVRLATQAMLASAGYDVAKAVELAEKLAQVEKKRADELP